MKNSITVPILNNEYKVIVCWGKPEEIRRIMKLWHHTIMDGEKDLENRRGVCFYSKDAHPIIALPRFPKTAEEIGTLAHEAVHAIDDIFLKVQENPQGEIFAHSVGAVVRGVLK